MAVLSPPPEYDPQAVEREIADFWKAQRIFERSVTEREGSPRFNFIDGPPTANGLPGSHHVISRALKDLIPRYQTMRGFQVPRKAGWDTHGLPVEIGVERDLGITSKGEIEKLGVAKFNELCRQSVWKYEAEWRKMSERMAYWVDMDDPFITLSPEYVESVWWALRQIYDKGLLFKGLRVAPYCPRCGTTLSSHEVSQGYDEVEDPSVYLRFPLKEMRAGPPRAILGWTTTPWTLPSNVALAVAPNLDYVEVDHKGERLVLAEGLVKTSLKGASKVVARFKGSELVGAHYEPPFGFLPLPPDAKGAFRVYAADFVSSEEGTGVVHIAPAFGEDDADLARREGLPVLQPVDGAGRFKDAPGVPVAGQFFKDADAQLLEILKASGRLYRLGKHKHTYPFCWRCETPLMYFATDSWYIGMSRLRNEIKAVNEQVQWFPESYKWGRYGDFLENLKDWALSRERYWGTPLPVWRCPQGHEFVPGSYAQLKERTLGWPEPFDPHRPMVDELTVICGTCETRMTREPYVIDTWFDSGSCFFAQFHYPHENEEEFKRSFPADYIAEGIDQTRGWFYSMMAISTAIWGKPPYKRVLVNGLVLDKDGAKMSKSKKNTVDPWQIFNKEGADALRWYLFTQSPPWNDKRFEGSFAREAVAKFLLPFWNSYSFLATYGSIDGFDPDTAEATPARGPPIDRWLASRLSKAVTATTQAMEVMEVHKAARAIEDFVVLDLSTWWIRRSRDRFWAEEETADKKAAYASLHRALHTVSRLAAPFAPFIADKVYRALRSSSEPESVHLARWPEASAIDTDDALEAAMAHVRALVETGHRLRNEGGVKTRQPLREAFVVTTDAGYAALEPLLPLLVDELNVKVIRRVPSRDPYLHRSFNVSIKRLGPRFRGEAKAVAEAVERLPSDRVAAMVDAGKPVTFEYQNGRKSVELPAEYFEVERTPRPPFAVADVGPDALILNLELNEELRAEGFAREVIRCVQQTRKRSGLRVEDRIRLTLDLEEAAWKMLEPHVSWVARETQADAVNRGPSSGTNAWEIDGTKLGVTLSRAT